MKIAFLLGVSKYISQNSLPACFNDVNAMETILNDIAKYDNVIAINNNTTSDSVITQLRTFIETYKGEEIDELFFYFSGHGLYNENELFFILTDYIDDRKRRTCLINSEIDSMFKSLNPKLMIKVIDACNSGVTYIKGDNNIDKILKKSQEQFNNCYFMFSSQKNQFSYIGNDEKYSDFTRSFIKSLISDNKSTIRYKDILNFISDEFENNNVQTPLFINQASFVEEFASIDSSQRKKIKIDLLPEKDCDKLNNLETSKQNLKTLIEKDNERYVSEEQLQRIFKEIEAIFCNCELDKELKDIYAIESKIFETIVGEISSNEILKAKDIGRWLDDNKHNFFAQPTWKKEEYKKMVRSKNPFHAIAGIYEEKEVTAYRDVINSFEITYCSQPFYGIRLHLIPEEKYQNLKPFNITAIFLLSKLEIKMFYYFGYYKETSWNHYENDRDITWSSFNMCLYEFDKDKEKIISLLKRFMKHVVEILEKEFINTVACDETQLTNM